MNEWMNESINQSINQQFAVLMTIAVLTTVPKNENIWSTNPIHRDASSLYFKGSSEATARYDCVNKCASMNLPMDQMTIRIGAVAEDGSALIVPENE